jgi:hypothetical protein
VIILFDSKKPGLLYCNSIIEYLVFDFSGHENICKHREDLYSLISCFVVIYVRYEKEFVAIKKKKTEHDNKHLVLTLCVSGGSIRGQNW